MDWEDEDTEAREIHKVHASNKLTFFKNKKCSNGCSVHFVRLKNARDQVFQQHFKTRLKIDNVDIIILKDIWTLGDFPQNGVLSGGATFSLLQTNS